MWHGLLSCLGSGCAQSLYCKSGFTSILLQNWLAAFYFLLICFLSSCIVCCSICISCCLCSVSCRLTKWEGLFWYMAEFSLWVLECTLQPS
jgi:hypothetical protein